MEITNNEGQQIIISENAISQLQKAHQEGVWSVIVKDINEAAHCVVIPDNFN